MISNGDDNFTLVLLLVIVMNMFKVMILGDNLAVCMRTFLPNTIPYLGREGFFLFLRGRECENK